MYLQTASGEWGRTSEGPLRPAPVHSQGAEQGCGLTSPRLNALTAIGSGTRIGTEMMSDRASSSSGEGSMAVRSAGTPHCECVFSPHMISEPSVSNAPEYMRPASMERAASMACGGGQVTCRGSRCVTGVDRASFGCPSCPMLSSPKVYTRPDANLITRWSSPAASSTIGSRSSSGNGIGSAAPEPMKMMCCRVSTGRVRLSDGVMDGGVASSAHVPHDKGHIGLMKLSVDSHSPTCAQKKHSSRVSVHDSALMPTTTCQSATIRGKPACIRAWSRSILHGRRLSSRGVGASKPYSTGALIFNV